MYYEEIFTIENQEKLHEFREHLLVITNGLIEMCKAAGRKVPEANQLLRECYNLVDCELHTIEGWKQKGFKPREGQHGYLFWYNPQTRDYDKETSMIQFMFCKDQVEEPIEK